MNRGLLSVSDIHTDAQAPIMQHRPSPGVLRGVRAGLRCETARDSFGVVRLGHLPSGIFSLARHRHAPTSMARYGFPNPHFDIVCFSGGR